MTKVIIVTSAGRGLGTDIAREALAAGHQVVATGRRPEQCDGCALPVPGGTTQYQLDHPGVGTHLHPQLDSGHISSSEKVSGADGAFSARSVPPPYASHGSSTGRGELLKHWLQG